MAGEQPSQIIDVDNVRYLNKDAGALSKELGLISDETEALVGEIQARALTIAMLYQTGDDALKTALEEANLIVDDKNRDDVIVGKKFNSNLLFAFKDAEKEQADLLPEELLTNIAERLNQETSEVNFTDFSTVDKTSEEARAIVESKSGIQAEGRPFVPPANQIAGLAATDESKAFRDAILPIQAFIRSNYLDFPTDELGLDGKDFNFNIPTLGFLPDNVKEVIDAGRRLSEAHSAGEAPSQQDIDDGFVTLVLTADPIAPCATPITDSIEITIDQPAEITIIPNIAVGGAFFKSIHIRSQRVRLCRRLPTSPEAEYVFVSFVILGVAILDL